MAKIWKVVLILSGVILLTLVILLVMGFFKPQKAGILINTTPLATVFINGVQVGKTPYEATRDQGEISLKLVPDSASSKLTTFETKILLSAGIQTIVKRTFAEDDTKSSGEIVSFEKTNEQGASIALVSDPDSAQFSIDGTPRGFTPYKISVGLGQHQISVSAQDYATETLTVQTIAGYKLTAIVKLAKTDVQNTPSASPSPTPAPQIMIEILPTPNGFLRVRESPSTSSLEVGRVNPGDKFALLKEDSDSGWYQIAYQPETATTSAKLGWVSDQYAKKLTQAETPP